MEDISVKKSPEIRQKMADEHFGFIFVSPSDVWGNEAIRRVQQGMSGRQRFGLRNVKPGSGQMPRA